MADKRISQLIERTNIANNDVLPIVASGATTTNKVTISTIQDWMQDNLDVGVTSVGLSMPSAFVVSNSPVTASGNIAVTGAGTVSQYIRGDGSLADFPQSGGGGGASVNYYLNGSVSQGTIGGIAYYEMNRTPILGAGTNFTINANGYIASFITDAGNPGLLEIPGGNWNFETYFQASSGGGSPTFYVELYKVNSGGTATLVASNSANPELIAFGTTTTAYFSSLAVPTTVLTLTDRLALRYYVTHAGRTITMHTENSNLCQIITTFTTGLTALNGLTAQVQNFATGTTGTDFNISSSVSTHTFNIPDASATARGLVTTGSQTIAGAKTFSNDAIINGVNVGRGGGNLTNNTRFGTSALAANTTGTGNTSIGSSSLSLNTTGSLNTSIGTGSLQANTIGGSNTSVGVNSLLNNTGGDANTSVGASSLSSNITGDNNTSLGAVALYSNTTGTTNTANGFGALYSNTTGNNNVAVGSYSLYSNTTATGNTSSGYYSLFSNTTGNANTATGAYALENNTTGYQNTSNGYGSLEDNTTGNNNTGISHLALNKNTTGNDNTAVGTSALFANTTGSLNSAVGTSALNANTTGGNNTTLGHSSLQNNTTGGNNTAVGFAAGSVTNGGLNNATSSNSVYLGHDTRAGVSGNTNEIVIGAGARGNGSNTVVLGSDSITATFLKGAITLNGALTGTSATFAGRARFQGTGYDTLGSAEIMLANTTASTGRSFIVNSSNAGEFLISDVSAGHQTRLSINSSGAVTLTGALNGTSASFNTTNAITLTASDSRIRGGDTTGRLLLANSGTTTYGIFHGSSHATLPNAIQFYNDNTLSLSLASTGAATFSSSVTLSSSAPILALNGSAGSAVNTINFNSSGTTYASIISTGTSGEQRYSIGPSAGWGGFHTFYTDTVERMRITSGGNVLIGQTVASGVTNGIYLRKGQESGFIVTDDVAIQLARYNSNGDIQTFYRDNTKVGSISVTTTATSYNTSSDYRLKENVKPVENALSTIEKLKPCTFNFITESEEEVMGFLAHEVQEVIPQAVKGEKDAVKIEEVEVSPAELDEEGNIITEALIEEKEVPVYQGIDHSKLVPLLVAAIQEQQEQIKSLTEQVEALKSQING